MAKSLGLSRNVVAIGFTSLFADVSSEMVFGLLPAFMVSVLGIQMVAVGVIEGAAATTTSLLMAFSGWYSDRLGRRKPIAALGYLLSALVKPLFAFAGSSLQVLAVRVSDRTGKGVRTSPKDALIADSTDPLIRGRAFGFTRSMDTAGAIAGPLLALLLFPALSYRGIFLWSIVPGLVAVTTLVLFVREARGEGMRRQRRTILGSFASVNRRFKAYVAIVALFTIGNFSYAFFLLRAMSLGVPIEFALALYLIFNVVYALSAYPMGVLADRLGKRKMIALGYGMFGFTAVGFAVASSPLHAWALFVGYGLFFGTVDTVQRAIVPDLVSNEERGTAFGLLHTSIGIVALPAGVIAGALWEISGPATPFAIAALTSFISAALITLIRHK